MNTTFHMFHDRGSILSARCCFLPTCEGCACLFWSLPVLFDPRDKTCASQSKQQGHNLKKLYVFFFILYFFTPILLRALGKQMRKHFQFQSSAVGQQPQMLGNKQAAPGATVCPRSYLCVQTIWNNMRRSQQLLLWLVSVWKMLFIKKKKKQDAAF